MNIDNYNERRKAKLQLKLKQQAYSSNIATSSSTHRDNFFKTIDESKN